jgi:hypothetical protein
MSLSLRLRQGYFQQPANILTGSGDVFLAFGQQDIQFAKVWDNAEYGIYTIVIQLMGPFADSARHGYHRHLVRFGRFRYAIRGFAELGLKIDAALAGETKIGIGQFGLKVAEFDDDIDPFFQLAVGKRQQTGA